jgi:hypothetical protein
MLILGILQLLGIIALSFLVTPFIFYLIGMATSLIILAVNLAIRLARQKSLKGFPDVFEKFLRSANSVVYDSEQRKQEVYPPHYTHSVGVTREDRGYIPHVPKLKAQCYWKRNADNRHLHTPNQPIATKPEKVLNVFHRVILFYKSYYGHSTKVEKNHFISTNASLFYHS